MTMRPAFSVALLVLLVLAGVAATTAATYTSIITTYDASIEVDKSAREQSRREYAHTKHRTTSASNAVDCAVNSEQQNKKLYIARPDDTASTTTRFYSTEYPLSASAAATVEPEGAVDASSGKRNMFDIHRNSNTLWMIHPTNRKLSIYNTDNADRVTHSKTYDITEELVPATAAAAANITLLKIDQINLDTARNHFTFWTVDIASTGTVVYMSDMNKMGRGAPLDAATRPVFTSPRPGLRVTAMDIFFPMIYLATNDGSLYSVNLMRGMQVDVLIDGAQRPGDFPRFTDGILRVVDPQESLIVYSVNESSLLQVELSSGQYHVSEYIGAKVLGGAVKCAALDHRGQKLILGVVSV